MARRYSDDERASALAALAANAGNLSRTAADLGIPFSTLQQWARGTTHPEATADAIPKRADLAVLFEDFVSRTVGLTTDKDIKKASLRDRFVAAGIATDKMQLLRGKPTSINQHDLSGLSDDNLDRELEASERALRGVAAGEVSSNGETVSP